MIEESCALQTELKTNNKPDDYQLTSRTSNLWRNVGKSLVQLKESYLRQETLNEYQTQTGLKYHKAPTELKKKEI